MKAGEDEGTFDRWLKSNLCSFSLARPWKLEERAQIWRELRSRSSGSRKIRSQEKKEEKEKGTLH